jgi:hypothetical protein
MKLRWIEKKIFFLPYMGPDTIQSPLLVVLYLPFTTYEKSFWICLIHPLLLNMWFSTVLEEQ